MRQINKCISVFFFLSVAIQMAYAGDEVKDSLAAKTSPIVDYSSSYTLPEWMVTNSVSSVSFDNKEHSFATNFGNRLHGRLPGLTVSQTANEPGVDSPELYSRGIGTFFSEGKDILILVDGFQSFYEQLIPEEIETITLLKDAASTALYGMKGANGVLLITTKRGKEGPLKVDFSMQQGFGMPVRLPEFLNSYNYARLYNEALFNDNSALRYTEADMDSYRKGDDPYFHPDVDWYDAILRKYVPVSKYSLTLSGGQNKARYFVLLGATRTSGLYTGTAKLSEFTTNSSFTQYNVRANVDIDITNSLTVSTRLGFTVSNKNNPAGYTYNDMFDLLSSIPANSFPIYNRNATYGGNAKYANPWGNLLESGQFSVNKRTSQTSIIATQRLYMIAKGLSLSAAVSFNNSFTGYSAKSRNYERFAARKTADGRTEYVKFGDNTSLKASEDRFDQWRNYTFQTFLKYEAAFSENRICATAGFDSDSYTRQFDQTDYRHLGLNSRLSYSYKDKYIADVSLGYYGSNGFIKGKRFGFFPAVSLGWIVSEEPFLKGGNILDFLKLRASFGISGLNLLGNQRFRYKEYYHEQGSYIFGKTVIPGYADSHLANPDLTWERKREFNLGVDADLWSCLNFSLDVFHQFRYDILSIPNNRIPKYAGIVYPLWNIGEAENNGFEIKIGYEKEIMRELTLSAGIGMWYSKSKITSIPEIVKEDAYRMQAGKSINQPFLLEALGFFKDWDDIKNSPLQTFGPTQPGDIKYKDQNGDGIIDDRDYYPIGYNSIPELTAGLDLGIRYKNLYLNLFVQGVAGRSIILPSYYHAFQNDGQITSMALGRWTENTRETATYPRLSSHNNPNNHQAASSFWQRNGSYIKLRNMELGYYLPSSFTGRIGLKKASVFLNGTNLFSLDHVGVADPEILSGYPAMRTFCIGVSVEL